MNAKAQFRAPWGGALKLMTTLCFVLLCGIPPFAFFQVPRLAGWTGAGVVVVPLLILLGGAAFMVRGYTLEPGTLIVRRLGWSRRFDLSSLISATPDPTAMKRSIRLAGNGGLFAFCGWFYNKRLGRYRAFATDPKRSVVLRFRDRVLVVTPETPDQFADEIAKSAKGQ